MRKINLEYFANTLKLEMIKVLLVKVFLLYVIIEKMISVLHGQFNLVKCCMIIKKKTFIMIMQ